MTTGKRGVYPLPLASKLESNPSIITHWSASSTVRTFAELEKLSCGEPETLQDIPGTLPYGSYQNLISLCQSTGLLNHDERDLLRMLPWTWRFTYEPATRKRLVAFLRPFDGVIVDTPCFTLPELVRSCSQDDQHCRTIRNMNLNNVEVSCGSEQVSLTFSIWSPKSTSRCDIVPALRSLASSCPDISLPECEMLSTAWVPLKAIPSYNSLNAVIALLSHYPVLTKTRTSVLTHSNMWE